MPAWPGGTCPDCGEYMPENLIHCQQCRALLNPELKISSVEIPNFVPLREISPMAAIEVRGYYIGCPMCLKELRINRKYRGLQVQCKHCSGKFDLDFSQPQIEMAAFYTDCPHCNQELKARPKYLDTQVACKFCSGELQFVDPPA